MQILLKYRNPVLMPVSAAQLLLLCAVLTDGVVLVIPAIGRRQYCVQAPLLKDVTQIVLVQYLQDSTQEFVVGGGSI